jgi:hypothetical protein
MLANNEQFFVYQDAADGAKLKGSFPVILF